jgi:hypothetical protein
MSDDEGNVLKLFRGLSTTQAQQFRDAIYPTLKDLRGAIVTNQQPTKKGNAMETDVNFVDDLNDDEKAQFRADIDASRAKILQQRQAAANAKLKASFDAEIRAIAQAYRGDTKIFKITQLKARYRSLGLEVY